MSLESTPNNRTRALACYAYSTLLIVLAAFFLTGCCVRLAATVRNQSGRDLRFTVVRHSGPTEAVAIRAGTKARIAGVLPHLDGSPDAWIVTDGQSRFTFADVSPIAAMPDAFISCSRFTSDFPCRRVTQHVRLASDMTIHAVRVIGYTPTESRHSFQFATRRKRRRDDETHPA